MPRDLLDNELNHTHVYICAEDNHVNEGLRWMRKAKSVNGPFRPFRYDTTGTTKVIYQSWVLADFLIHENDNFHHVRLAGVQKSPRTSIFTVLLSDNSTRANVLLRTCSYRT
jgi:predicted secreted protein